MSKHLLSLVEDKKKVVSFHKYLAYSFDVKKKFERIDVNHITIYDRDMMNNYASFILEKRFKKLIAKIKELLETDDSEESFMTCLDMISKYEDILINEYKHYLKMKKYQAFIEKVTLLRDYVTSQMIVLNEEMDYNVRGGR